MDRAQKFLNKLDAKRRASIEHVLEKLNKKDFSDLDIKKLKGSNLFRVRKGNVRVVYSIGKKDKVNIAKIEFRNDNTY